MNLFFIDESRCRQDGLCAMVCPQELIVIEPGKNCPAAVDDAADRCINCGHCMAVCPEGALALEKMQDGPAYDAQQLPSFEQLTHLCRGRRSIRRYKKEPVSRELLVRIIDLARYAPTARNSQLIGWLVIDSREELDRLTVHVLDWMRHLVGTKDPLAAALGMETIIRVCEEGRDRILRGATGLVVVYAPAGYALGRVDASIALNTFELAAFVLGVGTCWAGFFAMAADNWPSLQEALGLPEGYKLCYAMMVGYPKITYQRLPERKPPQIIWR